MLSRLRRLFVVGCAAALLTTLLAATPAAAAPGNVTCTGPLSGTVNANVVVPPGASCTIVGTITGNLLVTRGATASVVGTVHGNVDVIAGTLETLGSRSTYDHNVVAVNATVTLIGRESLVWLVTIAGDAVFIHSHVRLMAGWVGKNLICVGSEVVDQGFGVGPGGRNIGCPPPY